MNVVVRLSALPLLCATQATVTDAAADAAITSPIELRDNFPLLTVQVDGIDVRLKFDLGDGDKLALQQSLLDRIGALPTGETARLKGLYGAFEAPVYKVARIHIGAIVFADVIARLDVRDHTYKAGAQGDDGFLGTGLLKRFALVLDYPGETMTPASRPASGVMSDDCSGTAVPFSPEWKGQPATEAHIDQGRVLLWWDTGSPVSALRTSLARDDSEKINEDALTSKRLVIGGKDFGPMQFQLWDMNLPGFDGFIGYDFFAAHVVCIDFPGNRLLIGP